MQPPLAETYVLLPKGTDTSAILGSAPDTVVQHFTIVPCTASGLAPMQGVQVRCSDAPSGEMPTEKVIARYRTAFSTLPDVPMLYLRGIQQFTALRSAVLAATDLGKQTILAEVTVDAEGKLPDGSQVLAALGVLQRIGVSTLVLRASEPAILREMLEQIAPYARISLGVCVKAAWLEQGFPSAEVFVPAVPSEAKAVQEALKHYQPPTQPERSHDDCFLAPDGRHAHFLDPLVHIADEMEVGSRLSERLIAAEDDAGAMKLQLESEDDLMVLESHLYMLSRPICLCAEQPELLESALRIYPGRALYDGTWPLPEEKLTYFAQKYGLIVL